MVFTRYDHRKLAFQHPRSNKKKRRQSLFEPDEFPKDVGVDTFGGLLGDGKVHVASNNITTRDERKLKRGVQTQRKLRRATVYVPNQRNNGELQLSDSDHEDAQSSFGTAQTRLHEMSSEFQNNNNDVEALSNVMFHLEEKQKKRQQEKLSEEFADIKSNLNKILEDFGIATNEEEEESGEFDMRLLTDPHFVTEVDEEKNHAKSVIDDILEFYSTLCQERQQILHNVHDSLEIDNELGNHQETALVIRNSNSKPGLEGKSHSVEDISSEITMTIENISKKTQRLQRLYNKLLRLCMENKNSNGYNVEIVQGEKREINLQQKVVGQFKKLQVIKTIRKEKAETWKYAANEIVDLLKSVRQEGAGDFEKLEREFRKLVDAYNSQGELLDDTQYRLQKQTDNLKKSEAIKEKLRNDNLIYQDDMDRYRVQHRTAQMKIQQVQTQLDQKEIEVTNLKTQAALQVSVIPTNVEEEEEFASKIISNVDNTELYDKINALQKTIRNYENEILELKKVNEAIRSQLKESKINEQVNLVQKVDSDFKKPLDSQEVSKEIISNEAIECFDCKVLSVKLTKLLKKINGLQSDKAIMIEKLHELEASDFIAAQVSKDSKVLLGTEISKKAIENSGNIIEKSSLEDEKVKIVSEEIPHLPVNDSVEKSYDLDEGVNIRPPPNSAEPPIEIYEEIYIEQTLLKTFSDKSIQVEGERDVMDTIKEEVDSNAEKEKEKVSDSVDNDISLIAEKIFGFVNLAGKLTKKIHRPKTSQSRLKNSDFEEDHRPATMPVASRDDWSNMRVNKNSKERNGEHGKGKDKNSKDNKGETSHNRKGEVIQDHGETNHNRKEETNHHNKGEIIHNRKGETNHNRKEETKHDRKAERDHNHKEETSHPRKEETNQNRKEETSNNRKVEIEHTRKEETNDNRIGETSHNHTGETKHNRKGEKKHAEETIHHHNDNDLSHSTKHVKVVSIVPPSVKTNQRSNTAKKRSQHSLPTEHSNHDHNVMERSWTESGFFDDSYRSKISKKENQSLWHDRSNNNQSGWSKLKYGRSHQVLKFLSRIAKSKCSLLQHATDDIRKEALTPEEAVMNELSVFADHAIDLLDVISFALKRIEIEHDERELEHNLANRVKDASLLTAAKPTWDQDSSVAAESAARKVQFDESERHIKLPRLSSAKDQVDVPDDDDRLGKVAHKKRQRVLERHKKLVERLRSSGVGMKQIYTILGISKSPNEEDDDLPSLEQNTVPPALQKSQREQIRRMSLIGHAFNSATAGEGAAAVANHQNLLKPIRDSPVSRPSLRGAGKRPTSISTGGGNNQASRKSFAANAMKKPGFFPPLPFKSDVQAPIMGNFFKTKPLASIKYA